jgi:hypothetical protein
MPTFGKEGKIPSPVAMTTTSKSYILFHLATSGRLPAIVVNFGVLERSDRVEGPANAGPGRFFKLMARVTHVTADQRSATVGNNLFAMQDFGMAD